MKDRNVQYPNRYRMTKVPGTDDIVDLIPAPGTVYEEGDFLNKSTLLTDALCTALGLDTTATPTEAMEKLRTLVIGKSQVVTGSYIGTGTYGSNNPNSLTFESVPKIFILAGYTYLSTKSITQIFTDYTNNIGFPIVWPENYTKYCGVGIGGATGSMYGKRNGNTIFWFADNFENQGNSVNFDYHYIAIL